MNTTLEIPTALVEDARRCLGYKSRTDTVVHALRELLRREMAESRTGTVDPGHERLSRYRRSSRGA